MDAIRAYASSRLPVSPRRLSVHNMVTPASAMASSFRQESAASAYRPRTRRTVARVSHACASSGRACKARSSSLSEAVNACRLCRIVALSTNTCGATSALFSQGCKIASAYPRNRRSPVARARAISNCAKGSAISSRLAVIARVGALVCLAPAGSSATTLSSLAGVYGAAHAAPNASNDSAQRSRLRYPRSRQPCAWCRYTAPVPIA
jgi:hypothetical protein